MRFAAGCFPGELGALDALQSWPYNVLTNVTTLRIAMVAAIESNAEQYGGKVTPVGNSKGIRLDAAFFKAHPEFNGEVRVTVLADGQVLLSAKGAKRRSSKSDETDPIMLGFLQFLEKQMVEHPDMIEPVDRAQLARIGKLVEGVDVE